MPKIFEYRGFVFFFFSNEGSPREPLHVHVRKGKSLAKFWIKNDDVFLADSFDISSQELNMLLKVVIENRILIEEKWYEFFGN